MSFPTLQQHIDCKLQIQSIMLESHKPSQLTYNQVTLPKVELSLITNNQSIYEPPSLDLDLINFKTTHELKENLQLQKKMLQEATTSVYVSRVSLWTIALYVVFTSLIVYFIYKKIVKNCKKMPENEYPENEVF